VNFIEYREAESELIAGSAELINGVKDLLANAKAAAEGHQPRYVPLIGAWSGTCVETAFAHVHNAEAALAYLYSPPELRAEIPEAVRRARSALVPNDPLLEVCSELSEFREWPGTDEPAVLDQKRKDLSKLIEASHAAADRHHSRLRTFRNILLVSTILAVILVSIVILIGYFQPNMGPLCSIQDPSPPEPSNNFACPTKQGREDNLAAAGAGALASPGDALAVGLMGFLGGVLSVAIFIRGLYLKSTSYNVLIPLALTKLPAGAMTAIAGLLFLAGDFIPGFSAIDTQSQILGYALVFGFAQQLFTKLVDRRAQELIDNIPTKAKDVDEEVKKGNDV
jgi:hypothetical protein